MQQKAKWNPIFNVDIEGAVFKEISRSYQVEMIKIGKDIQYNGIN